MIQGEKWEPIATLVRTEQATRGRQNNKRDSIQLRRKSISPSRVIEAFSPVLVGYANDL